MLRISTRTSSIIVRPIIGFFLGGTGGHGREGLRPEALLCGNFLMLQAARKERTLHETDFLSDSKLAKPLGMLEAAGQELEHEPEAH